MPLAFGPELAEDEPCLDGLPQAHLIGEDDPFRERGFQGEQPGFDLMGLEVDACIEERLGDPLEVPPGREPRNLMGEVLCMVRRYPLDNTARNAHLGLDLHDDVGRCCCPAERLRCFRPVSSGVCGSVGWRGPETVSDTPSGPS